MNQDQLELVSGQGQDCQRIVAVLVVRRAHHLQRRVELADARVIHEHDNAVEQRRAGLDAGSRQNVPIRHVAMTSGREDRGLQLAQPQGQRAWQASIGHDRHGVDEIADDSILPGEIRWSTRHSAAEGHARVAFEAREHSRPSAVYEGAQRELVRGRALRQCLASFRREPCGDASCRPPSARYRSNGFEAGVQRRVRERAAPVCNARCGILLLEPRDVCRHARIRARVPRPPVQQRSVGPMELTDHELCRPPVDEQVVARPDQHAAFRRQLEPRQATRRPLVEVEAVRGIRREPCGRVVSRLEIELLPLGLVGPVDDLHGARQCLPREHAS